MKAVLMINHGGPEMLRYGEAPDPTAGPGEVAVDIHKSNEITRNNGGLIQAQL
jgi:NADPH:quinone reductase-like Zn-dependent oxidoreductase